MSYFPAWPLVRKDVVHPDERLPAGQTLVMGVQHLVAMSGSTILGPLLMGFDPNLAILFSGLGTLLFFVLVGGRVPSYLGSSFSFIALVIATTGYSGHGLNPNIGVALGGIMTAGALYAAIGVLVMLTGGPWVEKLMPPAVTGAIGAAIGLNLAPVAIHDAQGSGAHVIVALSTVLATALVAAYAPRTLQRISILLGIAAGCGLYFGLANAAGLLPPLNFQDLVAAPWFGVPSFHAPRFEPGAMVIMAPVAFVLIAENLGHLKAIGAMTGSDLDPYVGRAFLADGLATMLAASGGGTGVTTYVENMGVMAITKVFSTLVFVVAALAAIGLGFSPKFGALLHLIPTPVLGGLAITVFGLIAAAMIRLWVDNQTDFSDPRNLISVGAALVLGAGNFTVQVGSFPIAGIGTATIAAIGLYHLLGIGRANAVRPTEPSAP